MVYAHWGEKIVFTSPLISCLMNIHCYLFGIDLWLCVYAFIHKSTVFFFEIKN